MALEPGGYIEPHSDRKNNEKRLGAVNYALNNPEGCKFYMEGYGIVPFRDGLAYKLDISNKHCIVNDSNEVRFHIIVHGIANKEMENKILNCYYKLDMK